MTQPALAVHDVSRDVQGVVTGTPVLTADGALPVEYLAAGDRVVTRSGLRVLRGISVRVIRRAALVRIGSGTLGIGRPDADVLVPAGQPVLIRDWRAQAMFGTPTAMIAAGRLVDGHLIRHEAQCDVRIYALQFDAPEVVHAGGLELGCRPQRVTA